MFADVSPPGASNSGAEATAIQALCDGLVPVTFTQRLNCGAFTAALGWDG